VPVTAEPVPRVAVEAPRRSWRGFPLAADVLVSTRGLQTLVLTVVVLLLSRHVVG
jgi:hypothetical protein